MMYGSRERNLVEMECCIYPHPKPYAHTHTDILVKSRHNYEQDKKIMRDSKMTWARFRDVIIVLLCL